jgi:chromate transport protein ChrA
MIAIWAIVAIILFGVSAYCIGRFGEDYDEKTSWLYAAFFGSLLWPVVFAFVTVLGPFFGLFWIGDRKRVQLDKEKSTTNK